VGTTLAAYERPTVRTLEADQIWDLIGPAQGYAVGIVTYPAYPLQGQQSGAGTSNLNRP